MQVKFEGQSYEFPDDATDEEVLSFLGRGTQPSAETQPTPEEALPQATGIIEGLKGAASDLKEAFTGEQRSTPETQQLQSWDYLPEVGSMNMAALKTAIGTNFAGPDEIAQILKSNFPDLGVRQDTKGNYIFRSAMDNEEYALTPGLTPHDLGRAALSLPLAALPVGKTLASAFGIGAGTQTAIEASQAATGGSIDLGEIAGAGALSAAIPGISRVASATKNALISPTEQAAMGAVNAITPSPAPLIGVEDLASVAKVAEKEGVLGESLETLAQQAQPKPELAQAAKELGLADNAISAEFLAESEAFKALAETAKSTSGSQTKSNFISSVQALSNKADETLRAWGATGDKGALQAGAKDTFIKDLKVLEEKANTAYAGLKSGMDVRAGVEADSALGFLEERIKDVGGVENLPPLEKKVYLALTPKLRKSTDSPPTSRILAADGRPIPSGSSTATVERELPTYGHFDDVTRDVGADAGNWNLSREDRGRAKNLFSLLSDDRDRLLGSLGKAEEAALARGLVSKRYSLLEEAQSLFGKKLEGSLDGRLQKVTRGLAAGDDQAFIKTMSAIPEQFRAEAASSAMRNVFGRMGENGTMNLGNFNKFWDAMQQNPRSMNALGTYLPKGAVSQLDNIAKLSKVIATPAKGESVAIMKSRLGKAEGMTEKLQDYSARMLVRSGVSTAVSKLPGVGFGVSWALTNILTPTMTGRLKALDSILASPEFLLTVKKLSTPDERIAVKKFTMSKAFKKFKDSVGNPRELDDAETLFLKTLQAYDRAETEEDLNKEPKL